METNKIPQAARMVQANLENQPIHKNLLNQKGSFPLILGVVVIIFVVLGAGGYLLAMNKNSKSNQYAPQPRSTSTQPTSSNETTNWKTYTGDSFSFKYPNDWFVSKQTPNEVIKEAVEIASCDINKDSYCNRNKNQITVAVQLIIDKTNVYFGAKNIEDYYQKQAKSANSGKNRKDITLDNQSAIRFSTIGGLGGQEGVQFNGDTVVTEYKGNLYSLTSAINVGPSGKSDNLNEAINIFDQILSTFKLISQ